MINHNAVKSPQMLPPPISREIDNVMLVQEAARASLAQAMYMKDAALATLDLIAAAEVRHLHIFSIV